MISKMFSSVVIISEDCAETVNLVLRDIDKIENAVTSKLMLSIFIAYMALAAGQPVDDFTRKEIIDSVKRALATYGIDNPHVVCDETNNPPYVLKKGVHQMFVGFEYGDTKYEIDYRAL